jgi:predicted nucleic acid-binding protein
MIDYWDSRSPRHAQTKKLIDEHIQLSNIWLSAITSMELLVGAANKEALSIITKRVKRFNTFFLTKEITITSLSLLQEYRLRYGLAIPDSLIAATAIETNLELFTYNTKDFTFIDGLQLYKPA